MKKNSHFGITRLSHDTSYSMHSFHSHSFCELFYLSKGSCNIYLNDSIYSVNAGTLLFIPPDTQHKTAYTDPNVNERISIELSFDYLTDLTDAMGHFEFIQEICGNFFVIDTEYKNDFKIIIEKLMEASKKSNKLSKCIIKTCVEQLFLIILMHGQRASNISKVKNREYSSNKAIKQAMNYIDLNYSLPITLEDVASQIHLNTSYFSKKFKAISGVSFKEYLNMVRINNSEKMLLETNKSITDIAMLCGYSSSNYFGDAFSHLNGISPTQFRKIRGNKN